MDTTLEKINSGYARGYGKWSLPHDFDKELALLVNNYISSTEDQRLLFSKGLTMKQMAVLRAFCERMASLALVEAATDMEAATDRLMEGLYAIVMEGFQDDYREDYLVLSLIKHSANKLFLDFNALSKTASSYASETVAKYLDDFRQNPSTIEDMGYIEVVAENGLHYKRTW